ncbi:DUF4294 domain-containing protein [Mucilaginibacter arboris]|uniref:DUF4294 domain-containing protein n=1 Tax=Mucilaginibacter arboris TaxID=2682090 RepID=A0A7K1SUE7_9SPHI|nr:DUF4294 domain-containing protein [Mucilaginibacter arboris]MVN20887.1 DUF4294 domain-containing protein [Mucilaginibacter arboris]
MKYLWFFGLFSCLSCVIKAQSTAETAAFKIKPGKNDSIKVAVTQLDGEFIPWVLLPDANIRDFRVFKTPEDRAAYNRLRYNVLKVLPYAQFAGARYRQLERDLATTGDKRKQKEMVKACEKEIKDLFNKQIKNLTITQGEILIKLVQRETGNTSFELLKQLKGGFQAFMFQSAARVFGHDLKETYNPEEDRDIEAILVSAGYSVYY